MNGPHAKGSGPAIGDHVTLTHEASGSVLHGVVHLCPTVGLVVDVDGRIFDMDREGWHVTQQDSEPPDGAVVVDRYDLAWQRHGTEWHPALDTVVDVSWTELRAVGPLELAWEPSR